MEKIRYFNFPISSIEEKKSESGYDSIVIRWVASTPSIDRHDDIVDLEAMKRAWFWYMQNPVVLLQHDYEKIIGKTFSYETDEANKQIVVTMELNNDIDGLYNNVRKGNLRALSVGFQLKDWKIEKIWEKDIRVITDLDLMEISVVTVPANPQAYFTLAKSVKQIFKELQEKPQSDDETAGEIPATPTQEVVEEVKEDGWNPPQEEPVWNPQEVPVSDNRYEELSARLEQIEEQLKSTNELVKKYHESLEQSDNERKEALTELKTLKTKLSKQEILVHKSSVGPSNVRYDLITGNYISL